MSAVDRRGIAPAVGGATVEVRGAVVRFDDRPVLDGVDLTLAAGEVVALLGASGSGKSTLLRVIAGLLDLDAGTVHIGGIDVAGVPTHRRGVGMVFQDNQLFTNLDVAGNIGYGLRTLARAARRQRVGELLALVGLDHTPDVERRAVTTLSGGEAKRVALARSLATSPRVLLLDEPLTGLDAELRDRLADDLAGILADRGVTAVLVTHERAEAERIATRIVDITDL